MCAFDFPPKITRHESLFMRNFKMRQANSVGLINWLRQPGQLLNHPPKSMLENPYPLIKSCGTRTVPAAETKSIGLQADALVPCFLLATLTVSS